jgi:hypothetical protein
MRPLQIAQTRIANKGRKAATTHPEKVANRK